MGDRCEARGCRDEATWIVRYGALIHNHRKDTARLCEKHAKARRDTRHAYIVERRPRSVRTRPDDSA